MVVITSATRRYAVGGRAIASVLGAFALLPREGHLYLAVVSERASTLVRGDWCGYTADKFFIIGDRIKIIDYQV